MMAALEGRTPPARGSGAAWGQKRRDLGYKKLLDLLLDMPEYVSIVRDEELPGGYRVVPTPQILSTGLQWR